MANRSDIFLEDDSINIVGSGDSPIVDVEGGNNWNLSTTDGDLRIGDDSNRLAVGVSLGGAGEGTSRLRAKGGTEQLKLGAGDNDTVTVRERTVSIGDDSTVFVDAPSGRIELDGGPETDAAIHLDPRTDRESYQRNVSSPVYVNGDGQIHLGTGEGEGELRMGEPGFDQTRLSGEGKLLLDGDALVQLRRRHTVESEFGQDTAWDPGVELDGIDGQVVAGGADVDGAVAVTDASGTTTAELRGDEGQIVTGGDGVNGSIMFKNEAGTPVGFLRADYDGDDGRNDLVIETAEGAEALRIEQDGTVHIDDESESD